MTASAADGFTTIVDTAALDRHRGDPGWVVVDCRHDLFDPGKGRAEYALGHIPGAHFLHADDDLAGPRTGTNGRHPLPDPQALAARLGACGIDAATQVVAYDAQGGMLAARLWWMLGWLGHRRAAVLDGGWKRWIAESRPVETAAPAVTPRRFVPAPRPSAVDVAAVEALVRAPRPDVVLVDARTADRYRGENETLDPIGGHIPGSLNRPFPDNLRDGRFKPAGELAREWRAVLGARRSADVIHSCGSGVSACHNILALAIAGLATGRLYAGSWSEWSADRARPMATGPTP